MINSLLIVCVGNICRSPAVEKLFKQQLKASISVSSAGLGAMVNHGIDPKMQSCMKKDGLHNLEHVARQFTREMAQEADLILVMEQGHLSVVANIAPEAAGKTMLLGKWDNDNAVEDPYRLSQEFFDGVFCQMKDYVLQWCEKIRP